MSLLCCSGGSLSRAPRSLSSATSIQAEAAAAGVEGRRRQPQAAGLTAGRAQCLRVTAAVQMICAC